MKFTPKNRNILVKTHTVEDAENTGVLLPDGYVQPRDKYVLATVVESASDCKRDTAYNSVHYESGTKVVVDAAMVESISIAGKQYEIVLENYVVGMFTEEE